MKFEDVKPCDLIVRMHPGDDDRSVYLVVGKTDDAAILTTGGCIYKDSWEWPHFHLLTEANLHAAVEQAAGAGALRQKVEALHRADPRGRFEGLLEKTYLNGFKVTEEAARISEVLLEALEKLKDIE